MTDDYDTHLKALEVWYRFADDEEKARLRLMLLLLVTAIDEGYRRPGYEVKVADQLAA